MYSRNVPMKDWVCLILHHDLPLSCSAKLQIAHLKYGIRLDSMILPMFFFYSVRGFRFILTHVDSTELPLIFKPSQIYIFMSIINSLHTNTNNMIIILYPSIVAATLLIVLICFWWTFYFPKIPFQSPIKDIWI